MPGAAPSLHKIPSDPKIAPPERSSLIPLDPPSKKGVTLPHLPDDRSPQMAQSRFPGTRPLWGWPGRTLMPTGGFTSSELLTEWRPDRLTVELIWKGQRSRQSRGPGTLPPHPPTVCDPCLLGGC